MTKKFFATLINSIMRFLMWIDKQKYKLVILTSVVFIILFLTSFGLYKYWSSPTFCKTCHIMEPYYESWKQSKHNNVRCVDCHFEPGIEHELRGKWVAIKQLASVLTGSYSPRLYAEISDASCLRSGCHTTRLLEGKSKFSPRSITFDHKPHLQQLRHGIKLACTSCHSQIVIGSHITATTSTCFLCHFKGASKRGLKENPLGGCGVCHGSPEKQIVRAKYSINHKNFTQAGIECTQCHIDVTFGEGDAPKDRCFQCHNQLDKLEKYSEKEFLHITHVTTHKIDCERCHNVIEHRFNTHLAETQHNVCQSCHEQMHNPQTFIYAGKGAKNITGQPDPMYAVGISCSGCHTVKKTDDEKIILEGQTYISGSLPCVSCHQNKYTTFVEQFCNKTNEIISMFTHRLNKIQQQLSDTTNKNILTIVKTVSENLEFLEKARPIHNPFYAISILKDCDSKLEQVESDLKIEYPANEDKVFEQETCYLCHNSLSRPRAKFELSDGRFFPHKKHVEEKIECSECHLGNEHPQKARSDEKFCGKCHE